MPIYAAANYSSRIDTLQESSSKKASWSRWSVVFLARALGARQSSHHRLRSSSRSPDAWSGTSDIMSLGGIAIAIGAMVVMRRSMVAHKALSISVTSVGASWIVASGEAVIRARKVSDAAVLLLLVITVSFIPVFSLEAQGDGSFFAPGVHKDLRCSSPRYWV
jgi:hypothetical protein